MHSLTFNDHPGDLAANQPLPESSSTSRVSDITNSGLVLPTAIGYLDRENVAQIQAAPTKLAADDYTIAFASQDMSGDVISYFESSDITLRPAANDHQAYLCPPRSPLPPILTSTWILAPEALVAPLPITGYAETWWCCKCGHGPYIVATRCVHGPCQHDKCSMCPKQ